MPALDDQIDDLLDTYYYHVTTPEMWKKIQNEGLRSGTNGIISVLTTNHPVVLNRYAAQRFDGTDMVVIRFNPCNLGIYTKKPPYDLSLPVSSQVVEIKTNLIGPLLLEKDCEIKIDRSE